MVGIFQGLKFLRISKFLFQLKFLLFIIECLYYDAHYNNASHIDCDVATCRSQLATIPAFQFILVFFSAVHYSYKVSMSYNQQ